MLAVVTGDEAMVPFFFLNRSMFSLMKNALVDRIHEQPASGFDAEDSEFARLVAAGDGASLNEPLRQEAAYILDTAVAALHDVCICVCQCVCVPVSVLLCLHGLALHECPPPPSSPPCEQQHQKDACLFAAAGRGTVVVCSFCWCFGLLAQMKELLEDFTSRGEPFVLLLMFLVCVEHTHTYTHTHMYTHAHQLPLWFPHCVPAFALISLPPPYSITRLAPNLCRPGRSCAACCPCPTANHHCRPRLAAQVRKDITHARTNTHTPCCPRQVTLAATFLHPDSAREPDAGPVRRGRVCAGCFTAEGGRRSGGNG